MNQIKKRWSAPLLFSFLVPFLLAINPAVSASAPLGIDFAVLNPTESLLSHDAGTKQVRIGITSTASLAGMRLVVKARAYRADGTPSAEVIGLWETSLATNRSSTERTIAVKIPAVGFYLLDIKIISIDGVVVSSRQVNLAALPHRNGVGPSDFGVGAMLDRGPNSPAVLLKIAKNAGFSWVRGELTWDSIEKTPGVFKFPRQFDESMQLAMHMDIATVIILDYGNPKAYPTLFENQQSFPVTHEARQRFLGYVREMVARYSRQVTYWELWNEPRLTEIGSAAYVNLLKAVYPVIKHGSPNAGVISCGGEWGGVGFDVCFNAIRDAGAISYQDGFSIHPYMYPSVPEIGYDGYGSPVAPVSIMTILPYIAKLTKDYPLSTGKRIELWVTEIGWPSAPVSARQDERIQAANLVRTYLLSRRYNVAKGIGWYNLVDDGVDKNDKEQNFGLLRADLTPKPAYVAAAVLAATLANRAWSRALIDSDVAKIYEYGPDSPIISGWTISEGGTVHVALPAGEYVERAWDGQDTVVTVTSRGLDWRLGPLPRYLIPRPSSQRGWSESTADNH